MLLHLIPVFNILIEEVFRLLDSNKAFSSFEFDLSKAHSQGIHVSMVPYQNTNAFR